MEHKNFTEVLNNSKDLTIGQIFKLLLKIKYKTLALFVAAFLAVTGSAYLAGQSNSQKDTAVMLHSPFSMRLMLNNSVFDLVNLTLIEDPALSSYSEEQITLSLRQIQSEFDIVPVGQVVVRKELTKSTPVWDWIFSKIKINEAHAEPIFNWNGHRKDFKFKEKQIDQYTMRRYYFDDCILEYKLSKVKRSIPSSFVWIKKTH